MKGDISRVKSFTGGGSIFRKECYHLGTRCYGGSYLNHDGYSDGERYFLYSATGKEGTWHLNASKAWEDKE